MKLFIDTADLNEIKRINDIGILNGVTTNPSLIAKLAHINTQDDIHQHYHKICEVVDGDISAEVIGTTYDDMVSEGRQLARIHPNIVVKIPMLPDGVHAIHTLREESIRTNCTLIFSVSQALLAAHAGATYISPFIGRLEDVGGDGIDLVDQIVTAVMPYPDTEVLAASIRNSAHVVECALAGADVASLPPKVFDEMFKHPLTDAGLEKFISDYKKIG